ncbi:MAG: MFS transporter, partial [Halobacteriales archaeon]|nr:MFS transporter [Halobacteriales archaeon]
MRREDWVLGLLLGGIHFTFHVYLRLIPPLIPVFTLEFSLPLWRLGLFMSLYFAGSTIGLLPMGQLSDAYDRRVLLPVALAIVACGFLLFAASPVIGAGVPTVVIAGEQFAGTFLVMGLGMVVAGLGSSAHIPVGVPLVTRNASPDATGTVLGIWGGASKLGDAAAPAMVGILILAFAWNEILHGFGLLGLVLAVGLYVALGFDRFDTRPGATDTGEPKLDWNPWQGDRRRYVYPLLALAGYFALYNIVVQGVVTFTPTFVTDIYGYTLTLGSLRFAPESFADFALSVLLIAAA